MSAEERLVERFVASLDEPRDWPDECCPECARPWGYDLIARAVLPDLDPTDLAAYLVERLGQDGAAKALGMEAIEAEEIGWSFNPPDGTYVYAFPPSETP